MLSPVQKAELLLRPEVASLGNGTLSLVFHSLLTGESGPNNTANAGENNKWTTPGHPLPTHKHLTTYYPNTPPTLRNGHREVLKDCIDVWIMLVMLDIECSDNRHKYTTKMFIYTI